MKNRKVIKVVLRAIWAVGWHVYFLNLSCEIYLYENVPVWAAIYVCLVLATVISWFDKFVKEWIRFMTEDFCNAAMDVKDIVTGHGEEVLKREEEGRGSSEEADI